MSEAAELEARKVMSQASFDEHSLLVAGRHLVKAVNEARKIFPSLNLDESTQGALKLLRDIYEHWDEQRDAFRGLEQPPQIAKRGERTRAEFASKFPSGRPWAISYGTAGPVLGDILPLAPFFADLETLEKDLLKIEAEWREQRRRT